MVYGKPRSYRDTKIDAMEAATPQYPQPHREVAAKDLQSGAMTVAANLLPRRSRRSRPVTNAHRSKATDENITVDSVAIADHVLRSGFPTVSARRSGPNRSRAEDTPAQRCVAIGRRGA
jgi:hypothetical protein